MDPDNSLYELEAEPVSVTLTQQPDGGPPNGSGTGSADKVVTEAGSDGSSKPSVSNGLVQGNSHEGLEVQVDFAHFASVMSAATVEMASSISEAQHEGLREFIQNQEIVLESLQNENSKFSSSERLKSLDELMQRGKLYQTKLVKLRKTMSDIKSRTVNLKKITEKLKLQKEKMAIGQEEERRREIERENLLLAQPVYVHTQK